jgi:hypothetical protein
MEGEALSEGSRSWAANLFIGYEQEGDPAGQRAAREQDSEGEESLDDSGFHVECARTGEASGVFGPRHGFEGAEGVNGIGVAEQEEMRRAARTGEIQLEGGTVTGEFVLADVRRERGEVCGDERYEGGNGFGRVGG